MPQQDEAKNIREQIEQLAQKALTDSAPRHFTPLRARVTRISIGRLFNLGSYEHKRYEIEIAVPEGQSAGEALMGVERILEALKPKCPVDVSHLGDLKRYREWTDAELARAWFLGDRSVEKWREDNESEIAKLEAQLKDWRDHQEKVRQLLDDLGAASQYKDAKLDWEDPNDE